MRNMYKISLGNCTEVNKFLPFLSIKKPKTYDEEAFSRMGRKIKNLLKKSTIKILPANQESSHPKIFIIYLGTSNPIAA